MLRTTGNCVTENGTNKVDMSTSIIWYPYSMEVIELTIKDLSMNPQIMNYQVFELSVMCFFPVPHVLHSTIDNRSYHSKKLSCAYFPLRKYNCHALS